ncbi:unnamed protein product [Effrenium voratum]|nr:unnamed protein product [Effrenium voratum]
MRMAMLGSSAKKIQSAWRIYLMRSLFQMIRERAILVQSHTRRWLVRNKVWNDMKPSQRRRSALFRAYLAANPSAAKSSGETDSEEEREAEAERQRLEKLRVSREEQEQQRREEERLQKEMEEKRRGKKRKRSAKDSRIGASPPGARGSATAQGGGRESPGAGPSEGRGGGEAKG